MAAKVMRAYEKEMFPSCNDLGALTDELEVDNKKGAESNALSMLMESMGRLNGAENEQSSPRASPRSSHQNLSSMGMLDNAFSTFEERVTMNTGSKSQPDLVALAAHSEDNSIAHNIENASLLHKFMQAIDKFLDVDGADEGTHFLVC
jgi:hypothetical protein